MELHRQMDAPRFASTLQRKMRAPAVLFLFIITISSITVRAQPSIADPQIDKIKQLSEEEKWVEIVRFAETDASPSAEVNYYYGLALARLERWSEATRAFRNGLKQTPGDKRFLLELAGVAFKQRKNTEAVEYLRRALRLDPADPYANDFLASLYFLQGNLEAALTYWIKVSKLRTAWPLWNSFSSSSNNRAGGTSLINLPSDAIGASVSGASV